MSAARGVALIAVVVAAAAGGWWARSWTAPAESALPVPALAAGPCPGGAEPDYWKAPMDPTYIRDEPGKSPMGMDLVPVCPDDASGGAGGVRIDPALVQSMGVRTARVGRRDLSRRLRAVGRVAYDERHVDHVHTKIQGWIEHLFVEYEGELVQRGQPLLEIYSPELVSTQEELLLAARYRSSTRDSRYEDVSRGGEDLFLATRRRLELWDVSEGEIERLLASKQVRKTLTLYAPSGGVVTHLMVRKGMEVGPNDNLYTIADLSRVWLYADVYEYELPWVREGQHADIALSYLPGRKFTGTVTYVYPYLDPETRTARVRIELDNPELILKPDMFANVTIETETRADVLTLPEEALIRSGRRTLVIVALGEGRFQPREVAVGLDSGDGWLEVRDGLAEGDRIVTSGQFLIDSESKLQEVVRKLLAAKSAADAGHAEHDPPAAAEGEPREADPHAGHLMPEPSDPEAGQATPEMRDPHAGHVMPTPSDPHAGHAEE